MQIIKKIQILEITVAMFLVLIVASMRLIPHPPNFVPIAAIALFAGVYFSKRTALLLPIAAMVISDIFIGYYEISLMVVVYGSFLLYVLLGFWLKKNKKWYTIGGSTILGAVLFFLITNFAVWILTPWYAKTLSGLIQCYFMALPFFRNTLLGDFFYVSAFFGIYELVRALAKAWVRKPINLYSIRI